MTENQRGIYLMLCMAGRTQEAEEYRAKCEAAEAAETASRPDGPVEENTT